GIGALEPDPVGVLVLGIDALRHRNDFGENIKFLGNAGTAAEQHVDDLFEIEQPERQFQVARVEHQRAVAEAAAILVVDVKQEYPQGGASPENLVQQQRNADRLADAGGAEDREVLGKHFLDIDIGDHGSVLLQRADIDLVGAARRVDGAKVLIGDEIDGIADRRIIGDAALELGPLATENLAEQVDRGGRDIAVGIRQVLAGHLGDHGDDGGSPAANADEAAHGGAHFRDRRLACREQSYPGERVAHRNHTSEGCHSVEPGCLEMGLAQYGQFQLAKRLS